MKSAKLVLATTWMLCAYTIQPIQAEITRAFVEGSAKTVRMLQQDGQVLLHADDLAAAIEWELKTVTAGRLVTFCKTESSEICVPIRLDRVVHSFQDGALYLRAIDVLPGLGLESAVEGEQLVLRTAGDATVDLADSTPEYHATWGPGRGFQTGQTLPDIPLFDLDGNEVRFSRFLGKQYIIYCWASW